MKVIMRNLPIFSHEKYIRDCRVKRHKYAVLKAGEEIILIPSMVSATTKECQFS